MSRRVILDSWAVLALLQGNSNAGSIITRAIERGAALMSWVNLGEVAYVLQRRVGKEEAHASVQDIRASVSVLLPDEGLILRAAEIRAAHPLAYADAFAAATAVTWDADLLTGDPELLIDKAPWRWIDLRVAPAS